MKVQGLPLFLTALFASLVQVDAARNGPAPGGSAPATGGERRARIYPAMTGVADVLADPANGPAWPSIRRHTHGIWVNAAGENADQTAGMLRMLDKDEYPAILPGGCGREDNGKIVCSSGASLRRLRTANERLAGSRKRLVATDRAFNLAAVIGKEPIEKIVAAINASEEDPEFKGIRSGILLHPRDGLNGKDELARQAIDAIDAGGVVAIEVSPSLLGHRNTISGCANIWRYAQSKGKQAVWLMNGPRYDVEDWLVNTRNALDSWKKEYGLVPDVIAPIATLVGDKMEILPEGDGSWPPKKPCTYTGAIHVLFGLCGWLDAPPVSAQKTNPIPAAKTVQPVPRPEVSSETISAWDARLLARIREELQAGRKPRFQWTALRDWAEIAEAGPQGDLRVQGRDGAALLAWPSLSLEDRRNMALGIARKESAADQALTAFYLLATGQEERAGPYLEKAGAAADEVKGAFK